jgi:hypothetical protein
MRRCTFLFCSSLLLSIVFSLTTSPLISSPLPCHTLLSPPPFCSNLHCPPPCITFLHSLFYTYLNLQFTHVRHYSPFLYQVAACLFLGSCFTALKDPNQTEGRPEDQSNHLPQFSFLSMLDSRVGLTRFVDMLRRPLTATR